MGLLAKVITKSKLIGGGATGVAAGGKSHEHFAGEFGSASRQPANPKPQTNVRTPRQAVQTTTWHSATAKSDSKAVSAARMLRAAQSV